MFQECRAADGSVVGMCGGRASGGCRAWRLGAVAAAALLAHGAPSSATGDAGNANSRSGDSTAAHGIPTYFGRATPPAGDEFRFVNGAEPEALDPALLSGQSDGRIAQALFEGLVVQHPRTLEPVPGVARRWEVSPDGRTYTFHLSVEARWSDGRRVTAADFEWSWLRVLHPDTPSRYADLFYLLRNGRAYKKREITGTVQVGVHARDDSTLVVELETSTPYFLQLITSYAFLPVPRWQVERWGDRWTRPEHIVGNGAFRLAEHRPNDRLVLVRNARYWDAAHVRLRKVIAYCSEDLATTLNMYRAGMTDWNPSGFIPAEYIPYVRHYADFRAGPFLATCFYSFNVTRPPCGDARVRRALALAVDREQITRYLLHGSKVAWGNVVAPGFAAYPYPAGVGYDPVQARQLLAAAGYPGGRGFPPVELLFNTSQDQRKIAEAVQAMWNRELGIDVQLANQEFGSYMRATTSLQYQIARRSWIADYNDPSTFLFVLRQGDGNNRTGWGDARFDSLLAEAAAELDPVRRGTLLAAAEAIALEAMPFMPLYAYETVELVAPYVRGWYPTAMDVHPLKDIWIERGARRTAAAPEAAP
jgi:oligopeptide transport system substrate-binding protein